MEPSALFLSRHGANFDIPWLRKLQEGPWLSSAGIGGYRVKNTFLDEAAKYEELGAMRRHHSEPKLHTSFASTESGLDRQLPSFLSSEVSSSFLSSGRMEGTNIVDEDVNEAEEMGGVTQINLTASSAESVGSDDDDLSWPQQEMRRHSCMAIATTSGGISQGENECSFERKSSSDSVPGDSNVSRKGSLEGTPPLDEMPWNDTVTTVMIRQLPLQCTQAMLMAEINTRGLANVFDFLYVPFDLKKRENVGYGFINFLEPMHAQACRDALDGTYLPLLVRRKPLTVHPAHLQGYEANYKYFVSTKMGKKRTPPRFSPVFLPCDGLSASKMLSTGPSRTTNPRHPKASGSRKLQRGQKPQHMFCHMCGAKQGIGRFCIKCGVGLETAVSIHFLN